MIDLSRHFVYDAEMYPNIFCIGFTRMDSGQRWIFEVSERENHIRPFVDFMFQLGGSGSRGVGFNNEHFDYPLIHIAPTLYDMSAEEVLHHLWNKSQAIFAAPRNDWTHHVWERDRIFQQVDLFKIMHFDNMARSTSLKKLEMAMRLASIEELPYKPGTRLIPEQIDPLITYMCWDKKATNDFSREIMDRIEFRAQLTERYGRDYTNFNDTRIGKQSFIDKLEQAGIACYERINGKRVPRQTPRTHGIKVADKLLNVPFETVELAKMWHFFKDQIIPPKETKGFFTGLSADLQGFQLDFGAGGIHGSVHSQTFHTNETHEIIDVDVTSYYPSLAIVNRWYPEHLGEEFCDIYEGTKQERVGYARGTAENAMLKLALNGVYGDSNNKYSPFYDPAYTMAITINGQLLLAWLAERIVLYVPGAELIQANTDGLTVYIPRNSRHTLERVCQDWQASTKLDLEAVRYKSMFVRDVNNYVSINDDEKVVPAIPGALDWDHKPGKVKRKNAYLTEPEWHQDHSSLVVQKAVDAFLRHGTDPTEFIYAHTDPFDFMRHVKVPRSSRLEYGGEVIQNVTRYHIALAGKPLVKVMPPLATAPDVERHIGIDVGWNVQVCNRVDQFDWHNLNRRWYVNEAEKLIRGVGLDI